MCCGFFVSIGTDLANKITGTVNPMIYISNIENSIFVPDVTENDVWNVIFFFFHAFISDKSPYYTGYINYNHRLLIIN